MADCVQRLVRVSSSHKKIVVAWLGWRGVDVNNLVGTDRGDCNKYAIGWRWPGQEPIKAGRRGGASCLAPHICARAMPLLPYRLHSVSAKV